MTRGRSALSDELPEIDIRDRAAAAAIVAGARLCGGLHQSLAEELELALQTDIDGDMPAGRGKVLAYALEDRFDPEIVRLSRMVFSDEVLIRIESFRRVANGWDRFGRAAIELSAAGSIAEEILKISPAGPGAERK